MFSLGVAVAQRLAPFGVSRFLYSDVNKKSENGVYVVEIKINPCRVFQSLPVISRISCLFLFWQVLLMLPLKPPSSLLDACQRSMFLASAV